MFRVVAKRFPSRYSQHLLQSCILAIFPYLAYMMADSLDLSGIVSILFAGIVSPIYCGLCMHEFHVWTCCADHEVLYGFSPFRICSPNHCQLFLYVIKALRNIRVSLPPWQVYVWAHSVRWWCVFLLPQFRVHGSSSFLGGANVEGI